MAAVSPSCSASVPVRVNHLASKFQPMTCELQLLHVGAAMSPVTVVHVYLPQWMSMVSSFVDELADIIAVLTSECSDNIIMCGDMNCPGPSDSSVDVELSECFESFGLTQLVTEPTRRLPTLQTYSTSLPPAARSRSSTWTVCPTTA